MKDNNLTAFHVLYYMDKNNNIYLGETLFPDCPVRNILAGRRQMVAFADAPNDAAARVYAIL